MNMIYFDNAATSFPKPKCVKEAILFAVENLTSASRGAYPSAVAANKAIFSCREKLAFVFGAPRSANVVFCANATQALNTAIFGCLQKGDHVISTVFEHNSVIRPLAKIFANVDYVSPNEDFRFDYSRFENLITSKTKAIVCSHASNVTGDVVDLKTIGKICKKNNLLFIVDAAQSAGFLDINMKTMNIDVLCFAGHKALLGIQGVGGLCLSEGVELSPLFVGGSGQNSFSVSHPKNLPDMLEAGTQNAHGIFALNAGVDFVFENKKHIVETQNFLAQRFYNGLCELQKTKSISIYGNFDSKIVRCPIVSFNVGNFDSSQISDFLSAEKNIATRSGLHCAPKMHEFLKTTRQGAVRCSFSHFNTTQEIDFVLETLQRFI